MWLGPKYARPTGILIHVDMADKGGAAHCDFSSRYGGSLLLMYNTIYETLERKFKLAEKQGGRE